MARPPPWTKKKKTTIDMDVSVEVGPREAYSDTLNVGLMLVTKIG